MKTIKIGGKELKIQFAYEPTIKSKIISKTAKMTSLLSGGEGQDTLDKIEEVMLFMPELLLVGLQKYHKDSYGYNYDTNDGKEEQLSKVFALVEDYLDEGNDFTELFTELNDEMMNNGFLSKLNRLETERAEKAAIPIHTAKEEEKTNIES